MERSVEDDHRRTTGGRARDLDRILDGFGPGVHEEGALLALPTQGESSASRRHTSTHGLIRADDEALVQVPLGLLLDRLDDGRVAVAGVLAADAAGEVDVRPPVRVGDPSTLGVRDDELRRRHPGSDVASAVGEDPLRCRRVRRLHRRIICPGQGFGQLPALLRRRNLRAGAGVAQLVEQRHL